MEGRWCEKKSGTREARPKSQPTSPLTVPWLPFFVNEWWSSGLTSDTIREKQNFKKGITFLFQGVAGWTNTEEWSALSNRPRVWETFKTLGSSQ